jgi:hypothetical protein
MKGIELNCELSNKVYIVKKICKITDMPKNASYFDTIYYNKESQSIYRTDSGIYYAKPFNKY